MSSDADPVTSTADDAKARREARKARILNKGSDRLAKLTKQARGDDAEMLYPSSGSTSKATTTADQLKGDAPLDVNAMDDTADPPEIDISQQAAMDADLNRAMEMFAQQRQAQGQGQEQSQAQSQAQDPLQQMMAAMMGGSSAGNGPANGMPDLSQLFAAMQGNADQQQGGPQDPSSAAGNPFAPQPRGKTLSDRLFSFVHVALFVLVGYIFFSSTFSGSVTEPQTNPLITQDEDLYHSMIEKSQQLEYSDRIHKWASLAYYRPSVLDSKYYNVDAQWIGLGSDVVSGHGTTPPSGSRELNPRTHTTANTLSHPHSHLNTPNPSSDPPPFSSTTFVPPLHSSFSTPLSHTPMGTETRRQICQHPHHSSRRRGSVDLRLGRSYHL